MKTFKILLIFSWISLFHLAGFAQPNDNCTGATSLGTLPSPAVACIGGVRNGNPTTLTAQSTVGATAGSPYIYQTGCTGGTMTTFALDTWYSFVATGTTANVNITGFPNANVALYAGTCGNLLGRGCAIGNAAGNTTLIVTQITIGQTYYIQISGNTTTATDNNFTIAVDNDIDCNDCLLNSTITATPAPVNGGYTPGQVVNFCFTVNGWSQQNTNWFHGVQISMGSAWTGAITATVPASTQQTPSAGYNWLYYATSPGTANGIVWPPGFYFDTNDAGTNPLNNFGDNCNGTACTWTFCWSLTVSSACVPGGNLSVSVNTSGDGESGSWGSVACQDDPTTVFNAVQICCGPPTMAMTPVSCLGGSNGTVTATHGTGSSPWNYVWTNSLGTTVGTTVGSAAASNTVSGLPAGTYSVTITDNAGCVQTANVTVTTVDVLPPTAPNPAPISVPCLANVPAPNVLDVVGEADNITAVPTVTWIGDVDNGLNCPKTITRTYRVTDNCGMFTDVTQTITISPNAAPVVPANVLVNVVCSSTYAVPVAPVVSDQCGNNIVPVMTQNANPVCVGNKVFTFTYTDCAGNSSVYTYTYAINDNVNPTGTAPGPISASGTAPPPDVNLILDEADNCTASPTVTFVSDVSNGGVCPNIITRTYRITDACGNFINVTQQITLGDAIPPTASNPAPINVTCFANVPAPDPLVVTDEADNGATPVVTWESDVSNGASCPETITRTYRVTDDCGNFIFVTQTITIMMTAGPIVPANGASTVACLAAATQPAAPVVTSQCGTALVPVITSSANPACEGTKVYTYTYTDCAGAVAVYTYTYTIDMTVAPVVPSNGASTVACLSAATQPTAPVVTSQCGTPIVPVITASTSPSCEGTKVYTYTYTDCSGMASVYTYTYTIDMVAAPVVPANGSSSIQCVSSISVPVAPVVTDACGNNIVPVMTQNATPVCVGSKIYTFTYTDCSGNASVYTYTYSINDNVNPTASNPAPISVPGPLDVPAPNVAVVINEADNCTASPTVAWVSDVSDGNVCNGEIITRTYSVTDDCGNQIMVTQLITILATYPPIDAGPNQLVCSGGNVTLTAVNPTGAPIVWSPAPVANGVPFSPTTTGIYTVTADNLGCISTDNVTVAVDAAPTVNFNGNILSGCEPLTVTFSNTSISPSGFSNCVWNIEGAAPIVGCGNITYTFQNAGTYDVTLTTTSTGGCTASTTYSDYIYVEAAPDASFIPSSTNLSNLSTSVLFSNTSSGASSYLWNFGDGSTSSIVSPSHSFPAVQQGNYSVQLIAYSPLMCSDTASVTIKVEEDLIYYVPNSFTPDGDDYNEFFKPVFTSGFDPFDFNLFIYNRWGEIIWESHNAEVGWDGTYGGNLVQTGTYTWTIEFKKSKNDERVYINGHVTVIY